MNINKEVFREYDVRGVYPTDIDENLALVFGKAFLAGISSVTHNQLGVKNMS